MTNEINRSQLVPEVAYTDESNEFSVKQKYDATKTFSDPLEIVDKEYVDEKTGGASLQFGWNYQVNTDPSDPGSQNFRTNNTAIASVTEIYANDVNANNVNVGNILNALSAGDRLYVQSDDDRDAVGIYVVVSTTDNTGWHTITVTYESGGSETSFNSGSTSFIFLTSGGGGGGGSVTALNTYTNQSVITSGTYGTFIAGQAGTIASVDVGYIYTGPVSDDVTVDVYVASILIGTVTITDGTISGTTSTFTNATLAKFDEVRYVVTVGGSATVIGAGITITLNLA